MAKKHILVVMSNAADGREDEYNDWYTNVHLPDVLAIPGFVAAQRYKLGKEQRSNTPAKWGYTAIYEMETDEPKEVFAELGRRSGTPLMRVPDCIKDTWAYVYEPITGRVVASSK